MYWLISIWKLKLLRNQHMQLENRIGPVFSALLGLILLSSCTQKLTESHSLTADVAILHGTIVDGTGKPDYQGDIAITDDRIIYIGNNRKIEAKQVINAKGLIVSPGFIDGHSHVEQKIPQDEYKLNESSLTQGISTIIFGADGELSPKTIAGYLAKFKEQGIGTNVGFYVGHNGIREDVMRGHQRRAPSSDEMTLMKQQVYDGMKMGAVGFSTGLMYEPGIYSKTGEVIDLAKAIVPFGGIYDSHVRNPINALVESDQEVITIAKSAGVAGKIAHLKAVCLQNKGKSADIISMVEQARIDNFNIVSDQYPYDGAKTVFLDELIERLPSHKKSYTTVAEALLVPKINRELQDLSENGINDGFAWLKVVGYSCIRITKSDDFPELVGQYLSQIATAKNISGFALLTELITSASGTIQVTLGGIDEGEVQTVMQQPWNMIVSDGRYLNENSSLENHPRSTGTFPRILGRYVRELKVLTLVQAIKKMTSQPAEFLGLVDRGYLGVNAIADITIFDAKRIIDRSSYIEPLTYAVGIKHLLVSGEFAIRDGKITGRAPGKIVRREKPTSPFLNKIHSHVN
jgi:N-acyl-D-amino-acid deacylase